MRRLNPWALAVAAVVLILAGLIAWRILHEPAAEPDPAAPAALITVAPVRQSEIAETVSAYGTIAGSQAASRTLAAPRAVIVEQVLAAPGQPVAAGAPLIVLANTPATELAFRQATDAASFAERDLARVQRLYDQRLAANDQLGAARKAVADAKAAVAAQVAAGAGGGRQTLRASVTGVIEAAPVAAGEHAAADAPLMTLIASGGLIAQLGVEPTRAGRLAAGQNVVISSAFDPTRKIPSRLAVVGRQVDPATRLVTVTAPVPGAAPALGAAVEGVITVASHGGLVVPAAAVVYDEAGAHLFVIRGGKARQVTVKPGETQGDDLEVAGALTAGEPVAVQGAYQLQDGLAVRIRPR
ncbi:MAG: efflux RND transporter periplasmic adaptor subunit [Caulobacteraceae bacterium]